MLLQCMIGNKHGVIPLPATIDEQDFLALQKLAIKADKAMNKPLLEKWYWRDDSRTTVVYRLRRLSDHYDSVRYGRRLRFSQLRKTIIDLALRVQVHVYGCVKLKLDCVTG